MSASNGRIQRSSRQVFAEPWHTTLQTLASVGTFIVIAATALAAVLQLRRMRVAGRFTFRLAFARARAQVPVALSPRYLQPQFFRDPVHAAMPYRHAIAPQQRRQTTIAETRPLGRQLRDALAQAVVRCQFAVILLG
jgi:hypothetical protein